jgi:hypothetical protein
MSRVRKLDVDKIIDVLGIHKSAQGCRFDFFNRQILFDGNDFIDLSGDPVQPAVKTIFRQIKIAGKKMQTIFRHAGKQCFI